MNADGDTDDYLIYLGNLSDINDADEDGIPDEVDNCPNTPNPSQSDIDGDGVGDLCDTCPGDPTNNCDPAGSSAEEITVEEGGTIETEDGGFALDVDPGDLPGDVTISVTETVFNDPEVDLTLGPNAGLGQALEVYDLKPDGLVFDSPVTISIVADVTGMNPNLINRLSLYLHTDTDGDGIEDTFVEVENTQCEVVEDPPGVLTAYCSGEVSHFSTYALVAPLDADLDGISDDFAGEVDNCPDTPNPDQSDLDGDGQGDVCDPDVDGDGVPNEADLCDASDLRDIVIIDGCETGVINRVNAQGCSLMDIISELIAASSVNARNHGQFVQQMAHGFNELEKEGALTSGEKGLLQTCVGGSSVGKPRK